jgi:hypothetical protein
MRKKIGATQLGPSAWELLVESSARESEKRWRCGSTNSELTESSEGETVKIEPERVKLKNLHC